MGKIIKLTAPSDDTILFHDLIDRNHQRPQFTTHPPPPKYTITKPPSAKKNK